jgi:hypothetical protein
MIFLEILLFWHYVFAVVQKSSSPTHPGGNPPLIMVRAREATRDTGCRLNAMDIVDKTLMHPPCTLNITTGTVALLFKPHAIPSV